MRNMFKVVRTGVVALGLVVGLAILPGAALAESGALVTQDRLDFSFEVTDPNICGDIGHFSFSGTTFTTSVELADGSFHFRLVERGTYTLTFLDEPHETWESRFIEVGSFNAAPGETVTFNVAFNSFEGPIRIHEMQHFVVGPDGSIRLDDATFVVDECPPA